MSSTTVSQLCMEKGHFLKLIDSFAWEIGTLKKEMGKKSESRKKDHKAETKFGLGEEVGGLFMQASPHSRICTNLAGARDSGYDSFHRQLCILDRVVYTHPVWLLLSLSYKEATRILQNQPTGMFVVRKSASLQKKVISLRMDKDSPVPIKEFPVKESQYTFALEGSGLSFADLFRLVAFSCISRDVLPITLKLPEVIASAKTSADLEEVSKLGPGFWDTQLNHEQRRVAPLPGKATPRRPPFPAKRPVSWSTECPKLQTRTPAELDCYQSNGALCFINPLFIKSNQSNQDPGTTTARLKDKPITNNLEINSEEHPSCGTYPEASNLDLSDQTEPHNPIKTTQLLEQKTQPPATCQKLGAFSSSPPPRPPPPRFGARRSVPTVRQSSMPEKISWIGSSKERTKETTRDNLARLGLSLSISPSSSPPRKPIISFPISTPKLSPPRSLSFLSSSPRQSKVSSLSSSLEDAALEEQTIEKALHRAKLFQNSCRKNASQDTSGSPPQCSVMTRADRTETQQEDAEAGGESSSGGQRLSDMSLSTDSSDSLDFSGTFSIPPFHDPSPPTEAELNTYLPLSLPSSHLLYSSIDDDEDDDEDDEDPDYGINLESDQDQEVTMVPPGHRIHRRSSASALVIQQALRGQLRKMSGVFNSLLTPEKRVVRKVVELSRDKGSYFGCLVQDHLSYMGEGAGTQAWQGYTSGVELLQTLRQFMTQMKSYLRQSSEMEPPIESLIPEEQIDQVLEKAMHKCVLKPLKSVLSTALQEIQERSGAWRELKENLALAKARKPQEMGVAAMQPPDPVALEKIKQRFQTMCKLYSPEKKVTTLLRVCKLIYTVMEDNSGRLFGADDFLPMLTYILAKCDMPELDNEILYMMELLDPSQLHGEGGYYLTSAYGAMSLIRNFQEEQAARVLSSETRDTLCQWHRRRTAQRSAPSIDDFQNYLRVALQELDSGCTAKTLQVRPYATVEEVCQLCALKFKVSEPEKYGLFLLIEGSSQQLAPDTHPQKIKAELLSRPQPPPFHFVFRRLASNAPQLSPASGSNAPNNSSTTDLT